jgi:hypothetical protein
MKVRQTRPHGNEFIFLMGTPLSTDQNMKESDI